MKKFCYVLFLFCCLILFKNGHVLANNILFQNEFLFEHSGNSWIIDANDDSSGDIILQFGNTLNETIKYNISNNWFEFSSDINLQQNQIKDVVIDNLASAPVTPIAGQIYFNTTDGNTYVFNGTIWRQIDSSGGTNISGIEGETFTIDTNDTGGDLTLQFGTTLAESIKWDSFNSEFDFSDAVNLNDSNLDNVLSLDFSNNIFDPTLEEGKLWFRSDVDNLKFYANGRLQEIAVTEVGQFYDSNGGGGLFDLNVASWIAIPWNSESFAEDATYSHSTTSNNSRVYVNDNGLFLVTYSVIGNSDNNRKNIKCSVRLNGTTFPAVSGDSFSYSRNSSDSGANNSASVLINFSAGDYYEVVCKGQGSSGSYLLGSAAQEVSYTFIQLMRRN